MKKVVHHLKKMKRLDAIIIIFLLTASFIPHVVYGYHLSTIDADAQTIATVKIDGEVVYSVVLSEETPHELKTFYPSENQYNIVEVDGTRIRNKEDNSPDQVGVRKGWISRPGETAVVVPHKFIIEIHLESNQIEESDEEEVIIPL